MTQEEKQLLLTDLSARLQHGIMAKYYNSDEKEEMIGKIEVIDLSEEEPYVYIKDCGHCCYLDEFKIYLRPMSSITEEEKKDVLQSLNIHGDIDNEGNLLLGVECNIITLKVCKKYLGELNKRMFDVCHMIEKGLALKAPERMY